MSFFSKLKKAAGFELWHGKKILKGVLHNPKQLVFGIDPLGTKIGNTVFNDNARPLVDQLGGALDSRYAEYGRDAGYAQPLQGVAHVIASLYGGRGLQSAAGNLFAGANAGVSHGAGSGGGSIAPGTVAANTAQASSTLPSLGSSLAPGEAGGLVGNSGLGIFANDGLGGLSGIGGGNAGALAASGGIGGGAGALSGSAGGGVTNLLGGSSAGGSMGWGDWVNLAGQLYGAYAQGQGAKNAANANIKADQAAINEQHRQFDQTRQDQLPWMISGTAALGRLNDPTAFTQSPGYNFVRGEGQRGIENMFSAQGGAQSGNALRALAQYNQNLASQEYNNWFNQQSNLAGLGQTSAQSLGALGQNSANNVSNILGQQGNARASGIEGQTNATTGGIADFLSWYNRRRAGGG